MMRSACGELFLGPSLSFCLGAPSPTVRSFIEIVGASGVVNGTALKNCCNFYAK